MIVGVPQETTANERRVALVPDLVPKLTKAGMEVVVQLGAGTNAGFGDADYEKQGARLAADVFPQADIVLKVQPPISAETAALKEGAALIGFLQPYTNGSGI